MDTLRHLLRNRRYVSAALVTLLTLGIVGAVVLLTTSAGCGPASAMKIKTAHCPATLPVANNQAAPGSPSARGGFPSPSQRPNLNPPPDNPGASSNPPYNPGSSAYPPYNPDTSSYPPYNPAGSSNPPYEAGESGPPLPYPVPASAQAPPGVLFSCRLPVYAGGPGSGGFIVFPGQTFVADPRSAVTAPSPSPGTASPPPPPQYGGYPGWYGLTYDNRYSKWLPVPYRWVSPDGVHYAYALGGDIYVENVSNGTQLELAQGRGMVVLDVENDGVYAVTPNQPGLWFLPFSGTEKQVSTTEFWQGEANGAAYGTATSSVPQGATNTIDRLDLKTGAITPFFSQQGGQSSLTGFDLQGHPVIQVNYPSGIAIYIAYGTNAIVIASLAYGTYNQTAFPSGSPVADAHGLWFSAGSGILLYSNNTWYWMASIGGQLAGQCL